MSLNDEDGTPERSYHINLADWKGNQMDFVVYKKEEDDEGRVVELVRNRHCEVYEVIVDGIPVFNCNDYRQAEHEYSMECE